MPSALGVSDGEYKHARAQQSNTTFWPLFWLDKHDRYLKKLSFIVLIYQRNRIGKMYNIGRGVHLITRNPWSREIAHPRFRRLGSIFVLFGKSEHAGRVRSTRLLVRKSVNRAVCRESCPVALLILFTGSNREFLVYKFDF